ncbi:MAG: hypothetical protein WAW79_09840 [Steroidobacteraceae bacterium]
MGPDESRFLTWLRNHSKYMAVRGLLDYFRMGAVLVRGILINLLVILPPLLMIALAVSLVYGGYLHDLPDQSGPESSEAFFPTTTWAAWMQDHLRVTPPFLLTPFVLALAAAWVLLFPVVMMLTKIAGYNKSLATGSESSLKTRDRYERSFGAALFLVFAFALFELLPSAVHFFHHLRTTRLSDSGHWKEFLAVATAILGALSGAPKLLSVLSGMWKKLAMGLIGVVGLLVPLLIIVAVADFLVYEGISTGQEQLLFSLYAVTPGVFSVVIVCAILVGFFKRTFSGSEYRRLFALLVGMVAAHIVLITVLVFVWMLFHKYAMSYENVIPYVLTITSVSDLAPYFVLGCALEIWLFCWLAVDINLTSIHGLYRDRLASAYLLGLNARGRVDIEEDIPLAELCCHATGSTAPYHLINVALNLQGSKDINLRDRRSDFFIFSKKFIGGARTGYCRTATMEQVFPQIDLASAMAISAAAASPNMGRSTSPALVAFMTIINVRLGIWIPNPGLLEEALAGRNAKRQNGPGPSGRKPGFAFEEVFRGELVSIENRWEQLGRKGAKRCLARCTTPTVAHGLAGIGFSGGGIRSATINLGIAQVLHQAGIFDHFDYMSTVSGGGYLGSSISALMRYKTGPVSEIAGTVKVETTSGGEKIVTISPSQPGEARIHRYGKDAEMQVKSGEIVKPGTRLLRRRGPWLRSEIAGSVSVERLEEGEQIVLISGSQPGEVRQYRCAKYDELNVKQGQSIEAGTLLVKEKNSFGTRFAWRVRPRALLHEMTMRLDETHRWVNLSDGGHIENLATIELLRRRCKLIVIGDGEADPALHFNGLATLMRTARLDLGIRIDIRLDELRLDASRNSKTHLAIGRITYPGETECGYLLYLKSSCTGDEDDVIGEYRHRNPAFPHESTADQFFDEGQFEAYRALGQHIGEQAIEALALTRPRGEVGFAELVDCFRKFSEREERKGTGGATDAAVVGKER